MSSPVRLSRPVKLLLVSAFVMNACGFMVFPLLALLLKDRVRLTTWEVGSILSVYVLCARALPITGGLLVDRTSHLTSLLLGVAARATGFFGLAFGVQVPWLVACAAMAGLGGALYDPAVSSFFASQPVEARRNVFTAFNLALDVGFITGPLAGGLLATVSSRAPFIGAGVLVLLIGAALLIHRKGYAIKREQASSGRSLKTLLGDHKFLAFTACMSLFFIMSAQIYISLPLAMQKLADSRLLVSLIFTLNGAVGIAVMFWLRRRMGQWNSLHLIRIGAAIMATSLFLVPWLGSPLWLLACVVVFTIGETLVTPSAEMHIAELAADGAKGIYFGAFELSMALGVTVGNYAGGWFMSRGWHPHLPWGFYACAGAVLCVCLTLLARGHTPQIIERSTQP